MNAPTNYGHPGIRRYHRRRRRMAAAALAGVLVVAVGLVALGHSDDQRARPAGTTSEPLEFYYPDDAEPEYVAPLDDLDDLDGVTRRRAATTAPAAATPMGRKSARPRATPRR